MSARHTFGLVVEAFIANLAANGATPSTVAKSKWLWEDLAKRLADRPLAEITLGPHAEYQFGPYRALPLLPAVARKSVEGVDNDETTGHIVDMSKPNLRDQILTAGLGALHNRGFNATSVQDITEAAGAPKGSFYNHFASKEDLGAAVVDQYALRSAKRRAILSDASLAPLARIRSYFEALVALPKYPGAPGCLLGNFGAELSNQSPAIRERVSAAFEDWSFALARVIAEAQSAGDLKKDVSAELTAAFLIDAWEGAVLRAKVEQSRTPLEAFLEMTFARILV